MRYKCEATSLEGFVQQLATCYLRHGYSFFVTGTIPAKKDPQAVDRKLVELYGIDVGEWERWRRKRAGRANMQYLRFGRFYVLLATHGEHKFFELESKRDEKGREVRIRDARRSPIRFHGYAVSIRQGHVHVRLDDETFAGLRARFEELAVRRREETLVEELRWIGFEPYAPVRRQLLRILRAVNERRKKAGYSQLPPAETLRLRRRIVKPFESLDCVEDAA